MDKIKIIAEVKCNDGLAYVLNRKVKFTYDKIDWKTIIGKDEGALQFYYWDGRVGLFGCKAFGGREFTLKLSDGTEERCCGQWWDGMNKTSAKLYDYKDLEYFSFSTIDELRKCYVYTLCMCTKQWLESIKAKYQGKVYDYWEYEKIIKNKD